MPVINGVYLKDFTALPGAVADADIIPIAITGNQIAYRTTVAGIVTDARITGKLLTGLSITGGAVVAADTILQAFGKVQNQINGINLALYVPYTGATGAVNLGAYDLTVHSINIGRGAGSIATNTRVGTSALNANTTGTQNTSIGYFTLLNNTQGTSNTVLGYGCMSSNTIGTSNIAIGVSAFTINTTGSTNIAIGEQAGNYSHTPTTNNVSSSNSIYLGYDTRSSANGNTNEIVIGHQGNGNGSNTVTIGNSSIANNYFTGNVRGGAFIKTGGTSVEFLKADGSVDSVSYGTGSVTSVGLSMPSAFSVASSPITTSGTIAVTGAGLASQYIRGDGALADFPTTGGGGSSVSYYLNGSVSQGTFVGNTYYEMNKTPVIGAGTDFSIGADGYIAQFITDANDPASLLIPGGNWNVEMYFSASSNGGTPSFYVEVYKYNGTTFTLLGSSSATPEGITNGTAIDIYYTSVGIPETVLTLTDRIAIRVYVVASGRTITLHTEDNHLSEIVTTFSNGLTALNGLTKQVQYLAVGTAGTDFAISSSVDTHTFNIPDAGASARGLITTGTQTIAGFKTFSSTIKLTNGTSNGFSLESGTTGFYSSLKAPTGLAADIIVTLPSTTGTLALTSALSSYLPLSGGTLTGALSGTSATFSGQLIFPSTSKMEGSAAPNFILASTSAAGSGNGPYQTFKTNSSDFGYIGSEDALMSTTGNKLALLALNGLSFRTGSSYIERLSIASTGEATFTAASATPITAINTGQRELGLFRTSLDGGYMTFQSSGATSRGYIGNGGGISGASESSFGIRSESDLILMSGGNNVRATITSGGNVGIGTTSPSFKLHVVGGNFNQAILDNTGEQYTALDFRNNNTTKTDFYYDNTNTAFNIRTRVAGSLILSTNDTERMSIAAGGAVAVVGSLSKGSGSFRIEHPLPSLSETHQLVHSFIEGPKADLIYRGKLTLVNGKAQANIDEIATMTEGTFEVLCREVQCFTTNESGWDLVKGKVIGNIIYIESQNEKSTDEISWMVIGERKDKHMMDTEWTDENGKVIVEPLKPIEPEPMVDLTEVVEPIIPTDNNLE